MKRDLFTFLVVVAVFILSTNLTAQITIDGSFVDWAGIPALATDATGDGSGGWDIYKLYVTNDANNVYVRVEMAIGNGSSETDLFISVDPNTEPTPRTGLSYDWWSNGYDFLVQYHLNYTHLFEHTGVGSGYTWTDLGVNTAPFAWDGGKTNVEISMSKSLLDNPNITGWVKNSQTQIAVMTIANGTGGDILTNGGSYGGFNYSLSSPLPVELTTFTAAMTNSEAIVLNWKTATELNNYGFEIQRKRNEEIEIGDWEKIGFVQGHGNSNSPKNYSFADKSALNGTVEYRLKQIDIDGSFTYSEAVEAKLEKLPKGFVLNQNYPNPFNPATTIKYAVPALVNGELSKVMLKVYDILGNEVETLVNEQKSAGNYAVKFDASKLASGVYLYKLQSGNFNQTKKFLLMK